MDPNNTNNTIAVPQSVAEAASLVKQLYQPGNPTIITAIQDRLQTLQRSPDGWQLADAFLSDPDQNVRFFGALTFTVKLNNDGASLDEENAKAVLMRLISWLVRLVERGDAAIVVRKVCTTLVTFLLRAAGRWERPVFHLICSFRQGDAVSAEDVEKADVSSQQLIPALSKAQVNALFWFLGALAEEVGKAEYSGPAQAGFHVQMEGEVDDASKLMDYALRSQGEDCLGLKSEALKCYSTWINYAQPVWPTKPDALQRLRDLVDPAMQCLLIDDLENDALDVFIDVLESYTTFFQQSHMDTMASIIQTRFGPQLEESLRDQGGMYTPAGQFVVAYGIAALEDIVQKPDGERAQCTMPRLAAILKSSGYPGDDDELSLVSLEFWNAYIEFATDVYFSNSETSDQPAWVARAKELTTELNWMLWQKLFTPPNDITKQWGEPEKEAFKNFRTDTGDLLTSIYLFLGDAMLEQFVRLALESLHKQDWRALEAAMFCLNVIADNVLEDQILDVNLARLFDSSLYRDVGDFTIRIPTQCRKTAIDMLGNYSTYIERHAEALPDAMRFLFASLETAAFANTAAKSISSLCSTCRNNLTGELDGFLAQYQRFQNSPTCDPYTNEKVIGAVAAIIQALTPESAKAAPLNTLLSIIETALTSARQYMAADEVEMAQLTGASALQCLASIGKSLQAPDDIPITLDATDDDDPSTPNFWTTPPGLQIQHRITSTLNILSILSRDGDTISAACDVLRSGFPETSPGPFVLPPSVTVSLLQSCDPSTPQIEAVLATTATLLTQHSRPSSPPLNPESHAIFAHIHNLLAALVTPSQDPALSHAALDLLARFFPTYASTFLSAPTDQQTLILTFALRAIEAADPFPRRAALDLCTKLLHAARPSSPSSPDAQNLLSSFGPALTTTLVRQIAGLGQRSELDFVSDCFRALWGSLPGMARLWTEGALEGEGFPGVVAGVGGAERRRFLAAVGGLRGERRTREVCREFWGACRGLGGRW